MYLKNNKQTHLSMSELNELGFEVVQAYTRDEFMTQKRRKGFLTVKTTWFKNGQFDSQDLNIERVKCINLSTDELKALDKILNKKII